MLLSDVRNRSPYLAYADKLPSLPSVVMEVLKLCRKDNVDILDIAAVIGRDPALSARVLKLSNSSMYTRRRQVGTINDAVMVLGIKAVMLAALSFSLTSIVGVDSDEESGYDLRDFWRRSMIQSVAARAFARELQKPFVEEAFTCGLLLDISVPILARVAGSQYTAVIITMDGGHPDSVLEQQSVGATHADLGGLLMHEWKLPELMVDVIRSHHSPDQLIEKHDAKSLECARVLNLAHLSAGVLMADNKGEYLRELEDAAARWFGRDAGFVDSIIMALGPGAEQLAEVVQVDIGGEISPEEMVEIARAELLNLSLAAASDLNRAETRVAELEVKASTDALTGVYNRSAFDASMASEWSKRQGEEFPTPLGVIMVDVDHFKRFNDRFGHQTGDDVLRMVAGALKRCVRDSDVVCRYGGEEFAVVCPGAVGAALRGLGERLRRGIESCQVQTNEGPQSVTASLGAACLLSSTADKLAEQLVARADQALYEAKKTGRNRVCLAADW